MTASEIIDKYIAFFESKPRNHKRIPSASLIPNNNTTLFTTAGMQPLIPYLMGEKHPLGKRLVNVQKCLRTDDIEEVGDATHHTFYEMLGNWSLDDYWKEDAISWSFEFLTEELKVPLELLAVTVFEGDQNIPEDTESIAIWKKIGIPVNQIFSRPKKDNWWGPVGLTGPCGPDTEMFIWTGEEKPEGKPNENPNWVEVWNDVFMQYNKNEDGTFSILSQKNVDTGMGLERISAILQKRQTNYETDIFYDLYEGLKREIKHEINTVAEKQIRIFLDHARAAIFIINDGILPGKNEKEAVLRRLIRRATDQLTFLLEDYNHTKTFSWWKRSINHFEKVYRDRYTFNKNVLGIIETELNKYGETTKSPEIIQHVTERISADKDIDKGIVESQLARSQPGTNLSIFLKSQSLTSLPSVTAGTIAFEAKSTLGFPVEETYRIAEAKLGSDFDRYQADKTLNIWQTEHQKVSRISAGKKFAGGLADHSEKTIMGHTATHLMHQAIRDILGTHVHQTGSNITSQRIRFDFNYDKSLTGEQLSKIEEIVNGKIRANLPVHFEMLTLKKAKEIGAIGLFDEKYSDTVKIYFIGPKTKDSPRGEAGQRPYSIEFCGGPHVEQTSKIVKFSIIKQENTGRGNRRIYAKVG